MPGDLFLWHLLSKLSVILLILLFFLGGSYSSNGPDVEGEALIDLLSALHDSKNAIKGWDNSFVSPCYSWPHITCRNENVITLSLAAKGFSGTLSPSITKLKFLSSLELQDNNLSGVLPNYLGNLSQLQNLNLARNKFNGSVPSTWGQLSKLKHLDLSFNNLIGNIPIQLFSIPIFNFTGTRLTCGTSLEQPCVSGSPVPVSPRKSKFGVAITASTCGAFVLLLLGAIFAYRYRQVHKFRDDLFVDVAGEDECKLSFGQLKRFSWREIQLATDNFNESNVIGQGGFGKVYKGVLPDNTKVAVKRLSDYQSPGGESAFLREVHLISVAVHRNLLRLIGFCTTSSERILVYPFMPNLSVAYRLRGTYHTYTGKTKVGALFGGVMVGIACSTSAIYVMRKYRNYLKPGEKGLDWPTRKRVAFGAAHGLVYLHDHCNPRIIHRDLKAANILLDNDFEPVLGDFGLAKLVDTRLTHITTQVRGTMGHIAPEYLSTGQSSEKTDVFGYGITLLELVSGQRGMDFSRLEEEEEVFLLDHIKKLLREKKIEDIVDENLKSYDPKEVETMVQVALLCTQSSPEERPKMTEVVKMLQGVGLVERWAEWKQLEEVRNQEFSLIAHSSLWDEDSMHDQEAIELSQAR